MDKQQPASGPSFALAAAAATSALAGVTPGGTSGALALGGTPAVGPVGLLNEHRRDLFYTQNHHAQESQGPIPKKPERGVRRPSAPECQNKCRKSRQ